MSQPTKFTPSYDFSDFQTVNPTVPLPGNKVDENLNLIKTSTDQIINNLALLQRDDGKIINEGVHKDSLDAAVRALIVAGGVPRGAWATATAYAVKDLIEYTGATYICVNAHTSGTFDTDLAAGKWLLFASPASLTAVPFLQRISGNGVDTVFTLTQNFGTEEKLLEIYISGLRKDPIADYTINGTSLTFTSPPANGTNNIVVFGPAPAAAQALSETIAARDAAELAATNAATSETNSNISALLAQDWAIKTSAAVSGGEWSSKAHAIGGTGGPSTGSAKDWAQKTSGQVDSGYSSKEWALGTQTRGSSGGGSSKDWANYEGGTVDDAEYSSKKYAGDSRESATDAAAYAAAAQAAADAASALLSEAPWTTIVFVSDDVTVTSADDGTLYVFDTTTGDKNLTLVQIATAGTPFNIGVKKATSDNNKIIVSTTAPDTINTGGSTYEVTAAGASTTFVASTTPTPDNWTTVDFGVLGGDFTVDRFSGDGSTTAFILSKDPGSENNTQVYVNNSYVQKNAYSVTGTTLNFAVAPASGTNNIEVVIGQAVAIGIPNADSVGPLQLQDNSVSTTKLQANAVTSTKILDSAVTSAKLAADAVTEVKILDGAVTTNKLGALAVTAAKLAAASVTASKLAVGVVTGQTVSAGGANIRFLAENPDTSALVQVSGSDLASYVSSNLTNSSVSNAKMADMVANTVKARASSTGAPQDLSVSQILDFIGATQGQILYKSATTWAVLAPGTAGQVLQTNGAAANPSWVTPASGSGGLTGIAVFTSSGTWTVPTGVTQCKVTMCGGGQGGWGSSGANTYSFGGTAGATAVGFVTGLTAGQNISVTVGAGGAGAGSFAAGTPGGTTSFGTFLTAPGGADAGSGNPSGSALKWGVPGGLRGDPAPAASGPGGSSLLGAGGKSVPSGGGAAAVGYGGGGGGGGGTSTGNHGGGNGFSGIVIIEY